MAFALTDPEHGYYTTQQPFGKTGDFITAPDVSQLFGEMIAVWCVAQWQKLECPNVFILAELGGGKGTLMRDVLRTTRKIAPAFFDAAQVEMVEISPALQTIQKQHIEEFNKGEWFTDASQLNNTLPLILFANEFFDALPIEQHIKTAEGWHERWVDSTGFILGAPVSPPHFKNQPTRPLLSQGIRSEYAKTGRIPCESRGPEIFQSPLPLFTDAPEGSILEHSPAATTIFTQLCERLQNQKGAMLIIDYGYTDHAFGDTLQAVKNHQYVPVLDNIGKADITAHVNFAALKDIAVAKNLSPTLSTQRDFLHQYGIAARIAGLLKNASPAQQEELMSQYQRLVGVEEMGVLFKVLAVGG
jgi:SAM-dependent MidA family methyltransferase